MTSAAHDARPHRVDHENDWARPDGALLDAVLRQLRDVLLDVFDAPDGGLVLAVVRRAGGDRGDVEMAWVAALERAATLLGLRVRAIAAVGRDRAQVLRW